MQRLSSQVRQHVDTWFLRNRIVFANAAIVKRGEYIPRGSSGRISKVLANGDYEVEFYGCKKIHLSVRAADVTLSPFLGRANRWLAALMHRQKLIS